jgi:hypothetical protein
MQFSANYNDRNRLDFEPEQNIEALEDRPIIDEPIDDVNDILGILNNDGDQVNLMYNILKTYVKLSHFILVSPLS